MVGLLLLLALVFGVWLLNLNGRIKLLEERISILVDRMNAGNLPPVTAQRDLVVPGDEQPVPPVTKAYASRKPARVTDEIPADAPLVTIEPPAPQPAPDKKPVKTSQWSFEELVGGKLPIWVGGISLVFAGFFLVRYTIEAGLLGPGTRSLLASLFALLLIAGSQWGGRLPRIGESFSADPRIAQSLAGAGVAILYGTLYMAAEIYGLIGIAITLTLLIATTILAFALALRHGPPTALMGLIGGFAAPWVAGLGANNIPALLLYLGVFLAGLFGLALWRRWLWLLLLASGGGAIWTVGLIASAESALPLIGLFVIVAGGAAVLVGDRFAGGDPRLEAVARHAPMGLALVQLAMLLPRLEFSWIGWAFYGALSAAAIALALRDERHLPSLFGALLVCLMPLAAGWEGSAPRGMMAGASIGIGLLFAIPAHARAWEGGTGKAYWAMLALMAQAIPFAAAFAVAESEFSDLGWGVTSALLVLPASALAWRWRNAETRIDQIAQIASAALAAALAWLALTQILPNNYFASITIAVAAALSAWAIRTNGDGIQKLAAIPASFGILALAAGSWRFFDALFDALGGEKLMLSALPELAEAAKLTLLPALLALAMAALPNFALGRLVRRAAWLAGGAGLLAFAWLIAKQIAHIDSPSQFITLGLAERVAMTQLLFLAGWLALRRAHDGAGPWAKVGLAAFALALFRLCWFDLGVFNPVDVPQALGPAPIANLGTVHLGLAAFWLWHVARDPATTNAHPRLPLVAEIGSLALMALTALVTIRQMVQGNLISGASIDVGENYLYSAALLALSIGWLAVGIRTGLSILRLAGLALLTLVTLKVFLVDASALEGVLRILSFMGLGIALIGIGWAYGRVMRAGKAATE